MNEKMYQRYLETSIYTYVGMYKEFILSLPNDIPSIGMLVCDQITHPSMYFTRPSPYLENTYYGKFASYPKQRFKNEDELYITAVSMIYGILRLLLALSHGELAPRPSGCHSEKAERLEPLAFWSRNKKP